MRRFVEEAIVGSGPCCLDDFIDESNPVRMVDVFVDSPSARLKVRSRPSSSSNVNVWPREDRSASSQTNRRNNRSGAKIPFATDAFRLPWQVFSGALIFREEMRRASVVNTNISPRLEARVRRDYLPQAIEEIIAFLRTVTDVPVA
jgi:hypothetical protein